MSEWGSHQSDYAKNLQKAIFGEEDSEYRKAILEVLAEPWKYTHVNYYVFLPSCFLMPA